MRFGILITHTTATLRLRDSPPANAEEPCRCLYNARGASFANTCARHSPRFLSTSRCSNTYVAFANLSFIILVTSFHSAENICSSSRHEMAFISAMIALIGPVYNCLTEMLRRLHITRDEVGEKSHRAESSS